MITVVHIHRMDVEVSTSHLQFPYFLTTRIKIDGTGCLVMNLSSYRFQPETSIRLVQIFRVEGRMTTWRHLERRSGRLSLLVSWTVSSILRHISEVSYVSNIIYKLFPTDNKRVYSQTRVRLILEEKGVTTCLIFFFSVRDRNPAINVPSEKTCPPTERTEQDRVERTRHRRTRSVRGDPSPKG